MLYLHVVTHTSTSQVSAQTETQCSLCAHYSGVRCVCLELKCRAEDLMWIFSGIYSSKC